MAERTISPKHFVLLFVFISVIAADLLNINVREDIAAGSVLKTSLKRPASGLAYNMFKGGDQTAIKLFDVSPTGKITVKQKLNYVVGKRNKFDLIAVKRNVSSKYGGFADVVRITVQDVNNHSPVFKKSEYSGHIPEGSSAGSPVQGLEDCFATDQDSIGISRYTITSGNEKNLFTAKIKDISGLKLLVIETKGAIDREALGATPFVDLHVKAEDGGSPARQSAATKIRIRILDKNDHPPVFDKTNWRATVQENAPVMSSVVKVHATDNDEGSNKQLYYYFPDQQDDFLIDPYTGVIYVAAPLKYDAKSTYKIKVIVTDRAVDNPLASSCTVDITLVDVPGYPTASSTNTAPTFEGAPYTVTIRGDFPIKSFVLLPRANDKDGIGNSNGRLTFSLTPQASSNPFVINPKNGVISVGRSLPVAKVPIEFNVIAQDGGALQATAKVIITIRAINRNKNAPILNPSTVNVNIMEDASTTTTVLQAAATDTDAIEYLITGGTGLGRFSINENTGVVTPKVTFKSMGFYDLYIKARDKNQFRLSSTMYARINVKASNASSPKFSKAMYVAHVGEEEPSGTFVTAIFAEFPDTAKAVKYTVIKGDNALYFDHSTGIVSTMQKIDYEIDRKKSMEIDASVAGVSEKAKTIIDVQIVNKNDGSPVFPRARIEQRVPENMGYIPNFLCLFATDSDGSNHGSYSIKKGNIGNVFSIDEKTGQLSVKNLDFETTSTYNLTVEARDGKSGTVAQADVKVIVEDDNMIPEPAHFGSYNDIVNINEGSPALTTVIEFPVVGPSNSFTCDFGFDVSLTILEMFSVKTQSSSCLVETLKTMKWTKKNPFHKFTVRIISKANAMIWTLAGVTVKITDNNDHSPEFLQSSYVASVPVAMDVGTSILTVSATDEDGGDNGKVTYAFVVNADSGSFALDRITGLIKVQKALESGKEYKLIVRASDQAPSPKSKDVPVVIGVHAVNVKMPTFTSLKDIGTAQEGVSSGSVMNAQAAVPGGTIDYSIVGGNKGTAFGIDSNGIIFLKKSVDREAIAVYKLIVRAAKKGTTPALVKEKVFTVNIKDVNENSPVFNVQGANVEVTIQTNAPVGTVASLYRAYDTDAGVNGKVTYAVLPAVGGANVPFTAEINTGVVTTTQVITAVGTYNIRLQASDSGFPKKTTQLNIKVNVIAGPAKVPSFTDNSFKGTLQDNSAVGKRAGVISVKDSQLSDFIQLSIVSGNLDNSFCIDFGKTVYLQKPVDLDKYTQSNFEMVITMKYKNSISSTILWMRTVKENDNWPVFTDGNSPVVKYLPEDSARGTLIYQAKATDLDDPAGGITYGLFQVASKFSKDKFSVNALNGRVTLKNSLDYEQLDKHVITIKASETASRGAYALKNLIVKVRDINDEAPIFSVKSGQQYEAEIPKDAKPGDKVLQVFASDLDSGKNGEITYKLASDKYSLFNIDPDTGIITLKMGVALIQDSSFRFAATATDKGTPSKSGQAGVIVRTITSDGPPKFPMNPFRFSVDENTRLTGMAGALSVDTLTYSILSGNTADRFKIEKNTGSVSSVKALDAEQGMKYTLVIEARDTSERRSTSNVIITVINKNDNEPMFRNAKDGLIEKVVSNKVIAGETLLTVEGYDLDVGDALTYEITDKAMKDMFEIGSNSGVIKLKKALGKPVAGKNYAEFDVRASDRGQPQPVKSKVVKIRIVFASFKADHVKIQKSVPEDSPVSSSAIVVDLPRIYPLGGYQIMYPKNHPFKISAKSGDISLTKALDFEKVQKYDIVVQENNAQDTSLYVNYKLEIKVVDMNDNAPIFDMKKRTAKINKNARPGTQVIKLVATDKDSGDAGRISFDILTKDVPFTVNPLTHYIEVSKLNGLTKSQYAIDVRAVDGGLPQQTSKTVRLDIMVVNDPPMFGKTLYKFKVSENAKVEDIVGTVAAKSLSGIAIKYEIDPTNNKGDKFRVDDKGNIIVQRPLDYERDQSSYSLVVSAQEIAASSLKSITNVIIEMSNINDNAPQFSQIVYVKAEVREDIAVNSLILKVVATDKDCGASGVCAAGSLIYTTDAYKGTFKLDAMSGEIRNIKPLDFDTKKSYEFDVKVEDSGIVKRTAKARVIITLKNVNDNVPKFNPTKQTLYISEDVGIGVAVTVAKASDADFDQLTYAIETGDRAAFEINSNTGLVSVKASRLMSLSYTYKISASDGKHKGYFDLVINMDDKNDMAPTFSKCLLYKPTVKENEPAGTKVIKVTATDDDSGRNGKIEYSLLQTASKGATQGAGAAPSNAGSSETNDFIIDSEGYIKTNRIFDRETRSEYTLLAIARDGGPNRTQSERNSAACQLTVKISDENDNNPVFAIENYEVSVYDKTPVGSIILETSALDADEGINAQIEYSLVQDSNYFSIPDVNSGKISIKASLPITTYNFRVKASNPKTTRSSTVNVKVEVQDSKPPRFTSTTYRTTISEGRKAGFEIMSLSIKATSQTTVPNAKVVYSLPKGTMDQTNANAFSIDSETGRLKVAGELNYEAIKNYIVYVQAKDMSNSMVSNAIVRIGVLDENDNAPLFYLPKYEYVTVTEGQSAGVVVGQVYASDRDSTTNAELRYSFKKDTDSKKFKIDENTGQLTTSTTFDRELNEKMTVHVIAKDMGKPQQQNNVYLTVTIIDLNDNPPIFTKSLFSGNVKESSAIGFKFLQIEATDLDAGDNARVKFYITGGNADGYFVMSSSTFVKLGIAGTKRSKIKSSAWITVAKPLDRETKDTFRLTITATDSRYSRTAIAEIKVTDSNDNAPMFQRKFYTGSIKEGAKAGVVVTTVKAIDKDTAGVQKPIKYSLGKDAMGMFVIDPVKGVISTANVKFDREKKDSYRFTVIASDGKLEGTAIVKVTIEDVNDEAPYFPGSPYTRYIEERKPVGSVVGYVPAVDNDDPNAGGNAKITYSIVDANKEFKINGNTGLVTTLKVFNREDTAHSPIYKVKVTATDSGIPVLKNSTVVTIVVTDANDQDPKFTKKEFSGKVAECAPGGTVITTVTAVDKDDPKTVNAQLMYYVISSTHGSAKYFHVNDKTGVVTVAHGLDYERSSTYKLVVGVKDRGNPQRPVGRDEKATVDITVTDCNDNRPMFVPPSYAISVPENIAKGNTILTVTAVDKDRGSNGNFKFGIVDTETNFQFDISSSLKNKSKGIVKLLYPLDRENIAQHVFRVSASDMGLPKQIGYASVTITLTDINDNGPHFDKPDYCGQVTEGTLNKQVVVATIKVTDPDTIKYSCPCKFKILSGASGLFELTNQQDTSVQVVAKSAAVFDREAVQMYTMKIEASDRGTPPQKNVTTVKVEVHDKNDNEPSDGGSMSLLVNSYKGQFIGGVVGTVYINDNDRGTHDYYEHRLVSQSPGTYFSVKSKTGKIVAAAGVPDGVYKLQFKSKETNRAVGSNKGKEVSSSVTVTVRAISEKQAKTSVAIRLAGLIKAKTCSEIPYPEFEKLLAKILKVPVERVTVFSAQAVKGMHLGVDVRFAVKKAPKAGYAGDDSEYIDKSTLVPLLNSKKAEIEKATGAKVGAIGIDPCAKETCQVGFCYNDILPKRSFTVVTDDNGVVPANPSSKTFISIDVDVIASCVVGPRKPKSCKDKPCLYGGKCKDLVGGGYTCSCHKKSYDGPECQFTTKSFKTKNSYLWVKPFNYFYEGKLSFEFGTKEANGVILYQGPVSKISNTETKDFMAVELINGRIQISVNQGDKWRVFKRTINTQNKLNDGVFHSVTIYKRGKLIRVAVDECRDAKIVETSTLTTQDRSRCEITGIIGGPYRFINGLNPLQLGGIKNKQLAYPEMTVKDSFEGCIRKVTDNGMVYDLSKPIEERDVGTGCPLLAKCPNCNGNGYCLATQLPFRCICMFGWTGDYCDRRVNSYQYLSNSYTQYSFPKSTGLTWQQKYRSFYEVQLRTKTNGIVVYEASPTSTGKPKEYSILEVSNKQLQYRYDVGDGANVLILRGANVSDGKWHNVTVDRRGNFATLTIHGVATVSGTVGLHRLLESDGMIYAGGVPSKFNMKAPIDMQGCFADYRVRHTQLDSDLAVERKRVNVEKGCPCMGIVCLNGGVCVAGSPPYCICPAGFSGIDCGKSIITPEAGALAVVSKDGYMVMAVLLVVFLLALVLIALLLAGKLAAKKKVPVYVDDDPRDNIMPYHDEGAGEDDYGNFDIERLLKEAGSRRDAGLANGAAGKGEVVTEALLGRQDVAAVAAAPIKREKAGRFLSANVESVDVARFITTRLTEADTEDAAYPRDTLLHYGYEGEGSDVDDLSELGDSEDESDDDDADFGFLGDWGNKFDNLNKIFNPPADEYDDDV